MAFLRIFDDSTGGTSQPYALPAPASSFQLVYFTTDLNASSYVVEGSMDGVNWYSLGGPSQDTPTASNGTPAEYLRATYAPGGSPVATVIGAWVIH